MFEGDDVGYFVGVKEGVDEGEELVEVGLESFLGEGGLGVGVFVVEDSELGREELLEGWVVEGRGEEKVVPGDKP